MLIFSRKHMKTHYKPFLCFEGDCKHDPHGCATNNDLIRHELSIHGIIRESSVFYKCCLSNCPKAGLLHDRKDNFSEHIRRCHINGAKNKNQVREEDLAQWVEESIYKPTLKEVQDHMDRKRRAKASGSIVDTTIYDSSSVGQGQEPEQFAVPQIQEQNVQWMEPNYEHNSGGLLMESFDQDMHGLGLAAGPHLTGFDQSLEGLGHAADHSPSGSGLVFDSSQTFAQEPYPEVWDYSTGELLRGVNEEPKPELALQAWDYGASEVLQGVNEEPKLELALQAWGYGTEEFLPSFNEQPGPEPEPEPQFGPFGPFDS